MSIRDLVSLPQGPKAGIHLKVTRTSHVVELGHHFWWDFRNLAVVSHWSGLGTTGTWDSGRKNKKDAEAEAPAPATKKAKKGGSAVEVHVDNLNKLSSEEEKENWWKQEIDGGLECSITMV